MKNHETLPRVVLICHERDVLDTEGLTSWLASAMNLVGVIAIRERRPGRMWSVARREIRRRGVTGLIDTVMFRVYARLWLAHRDEAWKATELARIRARYPADLSAVARIVVSDPNQDEARDFLAALRADLTIARCKFILKPEIFRLARMGAFALHPGICPEYRNAHGCFWAMRHRDLSRVGMTLLKIDEGVDTGPIYLQATSHFDEIRDSHTVIQYRVVFDNLDAIARTLIDICRGEHLEPLPIAGRRSKTWGQPGLRDYLEWKRLARRESHSFAALS